MAKSSALNGKLVTLMGGSGFIGNYVAQALLDRGARLRVASRHPERAFNLKPLAKLGQLQFARCDVTDRRQVEQVIQGSDAVVNLVGSFQGNLKQLMGISAGWMAEAAAATGAEAFVQVSAIALRPDEDVEIDYAEAKHLGEDLVREAFPNATILRPSLLFGKDDDFTTMFAQMIRWLPVLPVFGPDKELQLVYVDDVAEAVAVALESPGEHGGKIFELGGPEKVTMLELNRRIAEAQRRSRTFLPMPDGVAGAFASLPGTPMGSDQWELLKQGNTVSGEHPGLAELGIEPKPLGLFLDKWMVRYRKHGRFGDRAMASGGL
ncbi:3-beta hydroxysteroid dehydrogenase [Erythrobacter sp. HI0063]|jgi:NADH dehydrogenase|uniref:complex I NDUFA9 subunit family protein n=1 Tax=Erythrobacter sp. HI0063 TaxID=1822240 RepID=UPI0007C25EF1|nr:complex I NDUFA9 subunit family protein [Erythrobacter sp. HI0063]KZY54340.1 3-beta hydroxysteroid dehydrogenase [Erythrobacter sp. HI0063]